MSDTDSLFDGIPVRQSAAHSAVDTDSIFAGIPVKPQPDAFNVAMMGAAAGISSAPPQQPFRPGIRMNGKLIQPPGGTPPVVSNPRMLSQSELGPYSGGPEVGKPTHLPLFDPAEATEQAQAGVPSNRAMLSYLAQNSGDQVPPAMQAKHSIGDVAEALSSMNPSLGRLLLPSLAQNGNPVAKGLLGAQKGVEDLLNPAGAIDMASGVVGDPLAALKSLGTMGAKTLLPSTVTDDKVSQSAQGLPIVRQTPDLTGYTRNLVGALATAYGGVEGLSHLRPQLDIPGINPIGKSGQFSSQTEPITLPQDGPTRHGVPIVGTDTAPPLPKTQLVTDSGTGPLSDTTTPSPQPSPPVGPHQQWAIDNWKQFVQGDLNDINGQISQLSGADKQTSHQLGAALRPIRDHLETILQNDTPPQDLLNELAQKRQLAVDAQNGTFTPDRIAQAAQTLGIEPDEVEAAIQHHSADATDAGDTEKPSGPIANAGPNAESGGISGGTVPVELDAGTKPSVAKEPVPTNTELAPGTELPERGADNPTRESATANPNSQPEPQGLTGIKNADTDAARTAKGLEESPKAPSITFEGELERGKNAVESGRINPDALASQINTKPRALSTEEQAALGYQISRIEASDRALTAEAALSKDPVRLQDIRSQRAVLESQWDNATKALKASGSRIAQSLGFRRVQFSDDFSPVAIKGRAAIAKGSPLTPEESFRADALSAKLKAAQDRITELESQQAVKTARTTGTRTYTRESLAAERSGILGKLAKLSSKASANPIDSIPDGLKLLKQLAMNVAREGFLTIDDLLTKVQSHLKPLGIDVTKQHLLDALTSESEDKKPPSQASLNTAEMRKQAFLQKSIDATVKAIENGDYKESAKKKGVDPSDELKRLQDRAKDLKAQHQALTDASKIHEAVKNGTYTEPEKKPVAEVSPELQEARDKLARAKSEARAFVRDQKPVSAIDVAGEIPRAAILANPTIAGHIAMAGPGTLAASELARLPASVRNFANSALYKITGGKAGSNQIVRQGFHLPDYVESVAKGFGRGVKEIPGYFAHGENSIQSAMRVKPDEYYGQHGLSTTLDRLKDMKSNKSARTVQNFLKTGRDLIHSIGLAHGAIQQPFAMMPGLKRSILEQAHIAATNLSESQLKSLDSSLSNLSGNQLRSSAKKFLTLNPTDAMLQGGLEEGLRIAMMQDNALTGVMKSVRDKLNTWERSPEGVPYGKVTNAALTSVMPVLKPATNAAFTAAEYTPLGAIRGTAGYVKAALEGNLSKLTTEERASLQLMFDRGLTGTALLAYGAYLYNNGSVTGSFRYPNDLASYKRGKSDTEGMNLNIGEQGIGLKSPSYPGTISVGGYGVPLHKLGAAGSILQYGADIARAEKESEGHSLGTAARAQAAAASENLNPAKPLIDAVQTFERDLAVPGKKAP